MADEFKIIAHRGASSEASDNSMTAFQLALAYGADMIETDVQYTSDHVLVVVHDPMIQGRKVTQNSLAELRQLDTK